MGIAVRAEGLSKMYHIGVMRSQNFREAVSEGVKKIVSKKKGDASEFWALKDISFEVQQGKVLGIIGRNGAGKSTLLKILSHITEPTKGKVEITGRVASLLEVGTGFHPELSGRENIFMNGAILGMKRSEIKRKFDEIVSFSGISQFIDTPVKRYSSGMYVRLAFAVAAHLEPEILIVDEVLAVGDAEFQKKCLGKMKDVSEHDGRTVLFVSHNLSAVNVLCSECILLNAGTLQLMGKTTDCIRTYVSSFSTVLSRAEWEVEDLAPGNENIRITEAKIESAAGDEITVESGIKFYLKCINKKPEINLTMSIFVHNEEDVLLFESAAFISQHNDSKSGAYETYGEIPPYLLAAGMYHVSILFGENQQFVLYSHPKLLQFEVRETFFNRGSNLNKVPGLVRPNVKWTVLQA